MVKQSEVKNWILVTGAFIAIVGNMIYEKWENEKPLPDIPVQSWDKYVELQKKSGKDI